MGILGITRNGRDAAVAAAVVKALEPRFEATDARFKASDARFEATDARWERRFEASELRFEALDAKWEHRFADLRNEMARLGQCFADFQVHFDRRADEIEAQISELFEHLREQIGQLSRPVVRGVSEPEPS